MIESLNPAVEGIICKGIFTLHDFHRIIEELRILAYQKWETAGMPDGRDFWDEAEKEYFRFHFVGDAAGVERTKFGLNRKVSDWK